MVDLLQTAKKYCKLSFLILSLSSSIWAQAFIPGENIKATEVNDYFSSIQNSFDQVNNSAQSFISTVDGHKNKINSNFEIESIKSSSSTFVELFRTNIEDGSYMCAITVPNSGAFANLRTSFLIGAVANPIATVNYPIAVSATNLQGYSFNLSHRSEVGSNFVIMFSTNNTFTNVTFKLKCRKVI